MPAPGRTERIELDDPAPRDGRRRRAGARADQRPRLRDRHPRDHPLGQPGGTAGGRRRHRPAVHVGGRARGEAPCPRLVRAEGRRWRRVDRRRGGARAGGRRPGQRRDQRGAALLGRADHRRLRPGRARRRGAGSPAGRAADPAAGRGPTAARARSFHEPDLGGAPPQPGDRAESHPPPLPRARRPLAHRSRRGRAPRDRLAPARYHVTEVGVPYSAAGARPRTSITINSNTVTTVSTISTVSEGLFQNRKIAAGTRIAPMRSARLFSPTQWPNGVVATPASPCTLPTPEPNQPRIRTAARYGPVSQATAATTSAIAAMMRSPRRR